MNDNFQNYKEEIDKINQRIKEYLWKQKYLFKTSISKYKNARSKFLAG